MIRERWRELIVPAALFATALLLAVPAALGPVRLNDSFWIDLVWLDQFAREIGHGVLYPRWLPLSHDGLGSPVFYYYPPLAFYLAATFALMGARTYLALVATFAAANLVSGAGAYLWLKDQSERPLAGALLFMIAPYHLFNFYLRGAIAEFVATAALPFVLWGMRQIIQGRPRGVGWTALAYAALVMTHLPLALLASIFLFVPYALANVGRRPALLARIGGAFALGVAVSAIYLLPALALEPYRSTSDLWTQTYLQPATWSIWSAQAWSNQTFRAVLLVSGALAVPAVALLLLHRSGWAAWGALCLVIGVGAVPLIWSLPVLQMVQFPFRLLPIAEIALITAAMLAPSDCVPWLILWVTFLLATGFIVGATPETAPSGDRVLRQFHPDVPENLPPGQRPYSWPSQWALQLAKEHRRPQFDGTTTVEPVFYFPAWQVRCGGRAVPSSPDPQTQLLTYRGRGCSRSLIITAPEKIGAVVSLLALFALLGLLFSPLLSERRRSLRRESPLRNT